MKPPPQTGLALPCRAEGHTPGVPPGPEQSLGPHTVGRETREEPRREYISQPGGAWIFLQSSLQVSSTSPPWPLLPWGHGPSLHTPAAWCGPWGLGRHAPSDLPPILLPCATLLLLPGRLQTRGGVFTVSLVHSPSVPHHHPITQAAPSTRRRSQRCLSHPLTQWPALPRTRAPWNEGPLAHKWFPDEEGF